MKKFFERFAVVLLALLLFTSFSFAQTISNTTSTTVKETVRGYSVCLDFGTVANSVTETGYVDLRDWKSIDSIAVSISGYNEVDVDSVNFWLGNYTNDGFICDAAAGVLYQASTLDVAASGSDFLNLVTTNATKLSKVALRGATGIKVQLESAASGNDATDPNDCWLMFHIYGTK